MGDAVYNAACKHADSREVGIGRLMMLTLTYLTTNQSGKSPHADHTLCGPLLQNSSLPTPGAGDTVLRALALWAPFTWQNNKTILFYFNASLPYKRSEGLGRHLAQ